MIKAPGLSLAAASSPPQLLCSSRRHVFASPDDNESELVLSSNLPAVQLSTRFFSLLSAGKKASATPTPAFCSGDNLIR